MTQVPLNDTFWLLAVKMDGEVWVPNGLVPSRDPQGKEQPWLWTDEDIVHTHETESPVWQRDIDLPDGLEDGEDDGADGEPREADDPQQTCMRWRRPAEKPAWLQQLCQRGRTQREPVQPALPASNGLAQVEAVFRGLGNFFRP